MQERLSDVLGPGFEHRAAEANGVRLHYVAGGSGDPLVLLHGWPSTWYMWRRVMPALAERFTVVAPDLRGFGDSGKPEGGYDTNTIVADLHDLFGQLGLGGRLTLVGHDMGAVHAYAYAASHPDRVERLAYLDEPLPGFGYEWVASLPNYHENGGFWFASFNMIPDLPEVLTAGKEREFLTYLLNTLSFNAAKVTPGVIDEYVRAFSQPGAMRASMGVYREIFTTSEQVKGHAQTKLALPVLALGGRYGMGEMPLDDMRRVAEDVRGGVVEECGHFIAEERPEHLVERLLAFVDETASAAG